MTANYVLLERITVGAAGASSVTFNNIPQTGYTDLKVVLSTRSTYGSSVYDQVLMKFNNSSSTFSWKTLQGAGSGTPSSFGNTNNAINDGQGGGATANTFGSYEVYIPNYLSSNYKSYSVDSVTETNATTIYAELTAGLWSTGSAISRIDFSQGSGSNFAQYSTFSLYALAAVGTTPTIASKATGGDIIQTDGTYWYHAFINSGNFIPQVPLTCDYLVVAGGGGGGNGNGGAGGGGAGGLRSTVTATGGGGSVESALMLTANTSYSVTIGAGGAASGYNNGVNTTFGSITATGGGAGGGYTVTPQGANGGSGGGSIGQGSGTKAGGLGTSNQGYAGGSGSTDEATYRNAGGGGGAGAAGVNGSGSGGGGNGGNGIYTAITDALGPLSGLGQLSSSHYYFAGGGGGFNGSPYGSGGLGGGASAANNGNSATANTGGGGGGGNSNGYSGGGSGGSGIVIVRYLA
jgi:hypothetical protein